MLPAACGTIACLHSLPPFQVCGVPRIHEPPSRIRESATAPGRNIAPDGFGMRSASLRPTTPHHCRRTPRVAPDRPRRVVPPGILLRRGSIPSVRMTAGSGIPDPPKSRPSQSRRCPPTPAQPTINPSPAGSGERLADVGSPPRPVSRLRPPNAYGWVHAPRIRRTTIWRASKPCRNRGGAVAAPAPSATDGPDRQHGGRTVRRPPDAVFNAGSCTRPRRRTSNCR